MVLQPMLAFQQADERLDTVADVAEEGALGGVLAGAVPAGWRGDDPHPGVVQPGTRARVSPGRGGEAAEVAVADGHQAGIAQGEAASRSSAAAGTRASRSGSMPTVAVSTSVNP